MSILIAEKSDIIRTGIKYILHEFDKGLTVNEITSGKKLLKQINKNEFALIFINPKLIDDTITFFDSIDKKNRPVFVAISENNDSKSDLFDESINLKISKEKFSKLVQKYSISNSNKDNNQTNSGLSAREKEIVSEIASGLTNKEIADKLFLSAHTVITHRKNITNKLGIKTTSGLTVYAIINNLIEIQ